MRTGIVFLAAVLLTPRISPAEPRVVVEDYRLELLAVDAASLGLFAYGVATESDVLWLGLIGAVAAAPTIHAVHGELPRGLVSAGLRVGAPLAGASLGYSLAECDEEDDSFCGNREAAIGAAAGLGVAMLADWLYLGRSEHIVDVQPTYTPTAGGGVVGLSGALP